MPRRAYLIFPVAIFVFLVALLSLVSLVRAESVLWNDTYTVMLGDRADGPGWVPWVTGGWWNQHIDPWVYSWVINPNVSVQYHIQVLDLDRGVPISCGASVAKGTHLKLEFVPHKYDDLYWFASGAVFDSPYGDWITGAEKPAADMCSDLAQKDFVANYTTEAGGNLRGGNYVLPGSIYTSFSVNAPVKTITSLSGLDCTASADGSQDCAANSIGTRQPAFNFAPTYAKFYSRTNTSSQGCLTSNRAARAMVGTNEYDLATYWANEDYVVNVPAQQLSCPITVTGPVGNPPAAPQLSSAACTVGTPQNISMSSTDPDGDQLRYGVDWDANGSIDQWVPASGNVSSGTTQTASRTYAIAGAKTVKVLAQDKNGNSSSWASISFSCAASATVGINENDNSGANSEGSGTIQLLPDLDLRVIPSLVRSGNTTKVNWSASNVSSCNVSAPNGDTWTALQSPLGGNISKPITGETTYTLSCIAPDGTTLTKSATVRILPTFQEI